ncbi:MAG: O-antigen polymerase [Suilimivivens sp.]
MKNRYNLVFSLGIGIIYMLIAISTYVFNYTIGQYLVLYIVTYVVFVFAFLKKTRSLKILATSLEFLYITAFSVYAIMPSIQYNMDGGMQRLRFFAITEVGVKISIRWYYVVFLILASIFLLFDYPKNKKMEMSIKNALVNAQHGRSQIIFDFIAVICLGLFLYSFLKNGISFFELNFVYRRKQSSFSLQQYVWLYMMVYSVEKYCEINFDKTISKKIPQVIVIITFWTLSLMIDRRHFIPVVVAIVLYYLIGSKKVDFKVVFVILLFGAVMVLYAVIRLGIKINGMSFNTFVYEGFSEFILTGYTTIYYATHTPHSFFLGRTYLWDTITRILPKVLFPWKPKDLAVIFMASALDNKVGFAFNPIAEGYLNFGNWLIFFVPLFFILFIKIGYKLSKKRPIYYLLFCAYFLDFNRGQFSNCIFDILVMYAILFLMERLKVKYD